MAIMAEQTFLARQVMLLICTILTRYIHKINRLFHPLTQAPKIVTSWFHVLELFNNSAGKKCMERYALIVNDLVPSDVT